MQKIIVISTNNNPDYLFFAKYQEKAWNALGWQLCIMITADVKPEDLDLPSYFQPTEKPSTIIIKLPDIPELRTQTIAQAGRLYAANELPEDALIMTCDMDLIPLSDYWHPSIDDITVYGHDLTWHSFYPMGYCAMSGLNWKKYMRLEGDTKTEMLRDAKEIELPFMPDWEQWWNHDWTLLTKRLKPHKHLITFVDRGQIDIAGATLAKGRIDRYNIEATQNQPPPFIDMHYHNTSLRNDRRDIVFEEIFNKFYP